MLDYNLNPILWFVFFLFLLLISIRAIKQISSWFWIISFLFISYTQGILFSLMFNLPIARFNYFDKAYIPIPISIMFGIFYFLLVPTIYTICWVYTKQDKDRFNDFTDTKIKNDLVNIWNMPSDQIKIIQFDDGDRPNAYRAVENKKLIIYFGKNLRKLLDENQLLFALSHEVAHFKYGDSRITFIVFCFFYMVFTCLISQIIVSMMLLNAGTFILITFILFLNGLIGLNFIRWQDEYSADYHGGAKLKDVEMFESFFQIEKMYEKDYGLLIDLIFFDHPPSERRLKNIQKLKSRS
jgi:Zn-dependent protease with chaperone function